jgi:hypothetical protein
MRKTTILALVVLSLAAQIPAMTYDAYCKLDVETRRRVFNQVTPENRAELVRTQVERWEEANRARLTPPQIALLKELIAFITPEAYSGGAASAAARERARDIQARQALIFTREELQEMQPSGPCFPKK